MVLNLSKMKKIILLLICFTAIVANAQKTVNISAQQYETLKQTKQLDQTKNYVINDISIDKQSLKHATKAKSPSSICSCLVPLDSSFIIAMAPNDDGSTASIPLPFSFNFYGTNYTSLFINNNGNVSFGTSYGTFTASGFPASTYIMLAPFWADVDTRGAGVVSYKITPTSIIVKWDTVGYYSTMTDKYDYTLIFEADAFIYTGLEEFVDIVHKACFISERDDVYYIGLANNPSRSKEKVDELFSQTAHNQDLAHAYLVRNKDKQWWKDRIADCEWDVGDLWYNHIFAKYPMKRYTTNKMYSNQTEGFSLLDQTIKTWNV